MQTFCPHPDPVVCARVLDNKRLNKQRFEGLQILRTLADPHGRTGWVHHPAVCMWRGFTNYLVIYLREICNECNRRGIADNTSVRNQVISYYDPGQTNRPPWFWGFPPFHVSHQ